MGVLEEWVRFMKLFSFSKSTMVVPCGPHVSSRKKHHFVTSGAEQEDKGHPWEGQLDNLEGMSRKLWETGKNMDKKHTTFVWKAGLVWRWCHFEDVFGQKIHDTVIHVLWQLSIFFWGFRCCPFQNQTPQNWEKRQERFPPGMGKRWALKVVPFKLLDPGASWKLGSPCGRVSWVFKK